MREWCLVVFTDGSFEWRDNSLANGVIIIVVVSVQFITNFGVWDFVGLGFTDSCRGAPRKVSMTNSKRRKIL